MPVFRHWEKSPNVVLRTSDQLLLRELTMQGQIYPILPLDMMGTWQNIRQIPLDFFHPTNNRMVWVGALSHNREMEVFLQYMEKQIIPGPLAPLLPGSDNPTAHQSRFQSGGRRPPDSGQPCGLRNPRSAPW